MSARDYLLDRLPLVAAFTGALLLLLLVVHLGYAALSLADALYILLLGGVLCAAILAVDHRRQRHFRREVARQLANAAVSVNTQAPLPAPATREQAALARLLEGRHQLASDELRHYRDRVTTHRDFTDQWVHQMKTPLSVLQLTVQEGLQRESDDEARELWHSAGEELDSMAEGLELMLAVARLDAFELDVRPARVDLESLVRDTVNDLKRTWIRNAIWPRIEAPAQEVIVESDAKWLAVAVRQLLTNAARYGSTPGSREGAGAERLVLISIERTDDGAVLRVADRGIGIREEDLPRVFERFFTGENGRLYRASTGMGLHLVGEISRKLGHRVELSSRQGEGTTVSVHFASRGLHKVAEEQGGDRKRAGHARTVTGS